MRELVIAMLMKTFGHRVAPFNDWSNVVDAAVYNNSGLRMVGARKTEICRLCKRKRQPEGAERCPQCQGLGVLDKGRPYSALFVTDGSGRRDTAREAAYCLPYLRAEIATVRPRAIVALGNSVLNGLMGLEGDKALRITRQRGNWLELDGVPVMPTYHPSYLLRNPSPVAKREFWTDLLAVMERLGMPISERQRGFYAPPPQRGLSE